MNPFYKSIQVRFGTVLAVIFELDARCCLRLLFFGIPIGTFQAFTSDFGHWGRTDDLNFTYFLFSMLYKPSAEKVFEFICETSI